jgi:hypothetical protein
MILSDTLRQAAAKFIRPSNLHAIAACPARPLMEAATVATMGEPEESPEASMGHRAHVFVADAIYNWKLSQETGEYGARWVDTIAMACHEASDAGLDAWTVRCIQFCLEAARDLIAKHEIAPDDVLVEHRLDMTDLGMAGGTADLVLVVPFKLVLVIDWKFTFMDQGDATDHDQLQAYATAAASTFKAQEVIVYLIAPRADKASRVTSATFDADTLRDNATWTRAVVARATAERPELRASYDACIYCRALTTCPAARKCIMDAQEALAVLGTPTTADDLGELASAAKLAEKFAEAGKELVRSEMIAGKAATGWKLGSPRATRAVVDVPAALAELEAAGIKPADLAQAGALTIKVGDLPDAAEAVIAGRITEKLSQPSLTQDKRARSA